MSTFSGLNAATTALWAQRRALDVTGQNIANVNTEGYSRQRVDLQAIGGSAVPAFYSTSPGIGAGVSADDVTRIRDAFLEGRGHTEHANSARLTAETDAYELVEQAFREPGDTGIQSLLSEMWAGWEDVANNPKDAGRPRPGAPAPGDAGRRPPLQPGARSARSGTRPGRTSTSWSTDVNAAAAHDRRRSTRRSSGATQSGLPANDLTDQRDVLVMKLADQVGATVRPGEDGVRRRHRRRHDPGVRQLGASELARRRRRPTRTLSAADPPRIVTAAGGYTVRAGGTAGGQLNALNTIIPGYRAQLDAIAAGPGHQPQRRARGRLRPRPAPPAGRSSGSVRRPDHRRRRSRS